MEIHIKATVEFYCNSGSGQLWSFDSRPPRLVLSCRFSNQTVAKPAAGHKIVGTSVPRLDIPAKVTGGASYVQDLRLSGMTFGRIVRPPGPGARLDAVDMEAARSLPGVLAVVRDGSFLGVVAQREEQAVRAREALLRSAKWSANWSKIAGLPEAERIHAWLKAQPGEVAVVNEKSSATAAPVVRRLEASFSKCYTAHASLGPSCAVAEMKAGKLRVWSHSQGVYPLRDSLAAVLKLDPKNVVVSHLEGAGCYGHNGADDVALDGLHGRGFGFARYKNLACYVACVADVTIDRQTGRISVTRVVAAADAGQIINPKGLEMQIEGGIIQSTSWTQMEAVSFDRTRVTSRDWASYPILTFPEVPQVEVHLIDRPDEKPLGSGEASSGPAAAAIANAVSNALGRRVRDLPLDPGWVRGGTG